MVMHCRYVIDINQQIIFVKKNNFFKYVQGEVIHIKFEGKKIFSNFYERSKSKFLSKFQSKKI